MLKNKSQQIYLNHYSIFRQTKKENMKKNIFTLGCLLALMVATNFSSAQAVSKGNIIIDPYYGYPNFGKKLISGITDSISDIEIGGIGPAGLRVEYMIAENFGLGFDFIYNSVSGDFEVDSLNNDGTVHSTYDVTSYARRFRFQVRANYHFVQEEAFDAYVGFGAGTNIRTAGFLTDYPNYDDESISGALLPVSARIALGTRYYFTDNIGLNFEIGIGGPILSAGLSIKL